ncbi:MAG: hypothetical protein AAGH92_01345 [Planctomycetota bacterium]
MSKAASWTVLVVCSFGLAVPLLWWSVWFAQTGGVTIFGETGSVIRVVDAASAAIEVSTGSAGVSHHSGLLPGMAVLSAIVLVGFAARGVRASSSAKA